MGGGRRRAEGGGRRRAEVGGGRRSSGASLQARPLSGGRFCFWARVAQLGAVSVETELETRPEQTTAPRMRSVAEKPVCRPENRSAPVEEALWRRESRRAPVEKPICCRDDRTAQ